jgi:hypothetical protein
MVSKFARPKSRLTPNVKKLHTLNLRQLGAPQKAATVDMFYCKK